MQRIIEDQFYRVWFRVDGISQPPVFVEAPNAGAVDDVIRLSFDGKVQIVTISEITHEMLDRAGL